MSSEAGESDKEAPQPLSEEQINAPSRQTLIMLSVICLTTLVCWAAGRAACNYHVPGESLTPRKTTLEERTGTAKDVGMEFGLALSGADFAVAEKLARGKALDFVRQEKTSCRDCPAREKARSKLLSVARVLESNASDSIVEVRTLGGPGGEVTRFLGIEREKRDYLVTRVYGSRDEAQLIGIVPEGAGGAGPEEASEEPSDEAAPPAVPQGAPVPSTTP